LSTAQKARLTPTELCYKHCNGSLVHVNWASRITNQCQSQGALKTHQTQNHHQACAFNDKGQQHNQRDFSRND